MSEAHFKLIPLHKLDEAFGVDRKTTEHAIASLGYLYRELACDPAEAKTEDKTTVVQKWAGTKQRDDLKRCPFCNTAAVQQVRLADNSTDTQWRIGCGNCFCFVEPNTPPFAALKDAEWAWQDRVPKAEAA